MQAAFRIIGLQDFNGLENPILECISVIRGVAGGMINNSTDRSLCRHFCLAIEQCKLLKIKKLVKCACLELRLDAVELAKH